MSHESKERVRQAMYLAHAAHFGATDKSGMPYIGHVSRVASNFQVRWVEAGHEMGTEDYYEGLTAAWLHDTVEDTWVTYEILREMGFSERVVELVDALTFRSGEETRSAYYARIVKAGPVAVMVKAGDQDDNTDPSRTEALVEPDKSRLAKKYEDGYRMLGVKPRWS